MRSLPVRRLIASPHSRALETAEIIADEVNLPVAVEPLVAERFCFICDIGSPLGELRARWPQFVFDHLADPWWPRMEETKERISQRAQYFRCRIACEAWSEVAVVTLWGFIRALTGLKVPNGAVLRIDPTRPDREPGPVLIPAAG